MALRHTLWLVDRIGRSHLTGNQTQELSETVHFLNAAFMDPLISDAADNLEVKLVTSGAAFQRGDAVVFLVADAGQSIIGKRRGPVTVGPKVLGKTSIGGLPSLAEVYWNRCVSSLEVAGAVFHEAAHGMSQQADGMHSFVAPGAGTTRVRVLAAQQPGIAQFPSWGDLIFYEAAIKRGTQFVTTP